jgi:hypothetical protein
MAGFKECGSTIITDKVVLLGNCTGGGAMAKLACYNWHAVWG